MAKDLIDLLRSCNAWVDPNLIALVPGGAVEGGESKRKRRKHNKNGEEGTAVDTIAHINNKKKKTDSSMNSIDMESEDEFPALSQNRIVLKRASHVSQDDSDDEDSS